jgi:CHAT domain-containing protein
MKHDYLDSAQRLYDWIVRPIEKSLEDEAIDTLVFVADGELRAIPMAALHDGKQFLIGRYAVCVSPGLTLTAPQPLTARKRIDVLSAGLSEPRGGFSALPSVPEELSGIEGLYAGIRLQDEQFLVKNFASRFEGDTFTIVHIASHGLFAGDAVDTFVLAYDEPLKLDDLEKLIYPSQFRGEPVELLTLSACQTAEGDEGRAALGLAGVAVKAGARSALATLWAVDDKASSILVVDFYRELKNSPSMSKARALQQAQLKLLADPRYDHPACWAPYLLIGNWL